MRLHILPKHGVDHNYVGENHLALDFSKNAAELVHKISRPIFSFETAIFTYCRVFNNGKILYLCSDEKWVEHYFASNYQNESDHLKHYVPLENIKYALWSEFDRDKVFRAAYEEFNYWHGISFYEKNKNHMDYFDFGANKDNVKMENFYLNNLPVLSQFIQYFKEEASDLINVSDSTKLISCENKEIISNIFRLKSPEEENKIVQFPFQEKRQENSFIDSMGFTCNEKECLLYLYQGKSIKEIGEALKIPAKSAEFYIKSIKFKAESLTKSDLHNVLKSDSKFSLIFSYTPDGSVESKNIKSSYFYNNLIYIFCFLSSIFIFYLSSFYESISSMFHSIMTFCLS
jgi:DNA-binding CsgD family transcriptional regulator